MIPYKQLSLADVFEDCKQLFDEDKPEFLALLESHINLDDLIPFSFSNKYYASTGRPRKYHLHSMLWALIIQRLFSIDTDKLLILFLTYAKDIREFCGFYNGVPNVSRITRFKQDFLLELQAVFDRLVDLTEPICQAIDAEKASMTIFDSSGIEAFVTENNPKYANRIVKQLKAYAKANHFDDAYDPYKAAYASMPSHASANPAIKQLYANGHFCYVYKFGLVTNGLGIVRDIAFFNKTFFANHPEIVVEKKSDSPDEDKSVHDARLLLPVLGDFFETHPGIKPQTFLGDAAFDAVHIYQGLLSADAFGENKCFDKAYIPLNARGNFKSDDYTINADGIPCCPKDKALTMRPEGTSKLRGNVKRFKFVCPKMRWVKCNDGKYRRRTHCKDPCTTSRCGRMIYVYPEKDLRTCPGVIRGTDDWNRNYKDRCAVERTIQHFKDSFGVAGRKTQNEKTLHADLLLSGITQLISVLLADKIHKHEYIRSIKKLIA